ncbi:hypothetical protein RhiJN_21057 [Ceratobasidium sp. AG-Ba]|nr:hypothetical protein RhiJN_21057 [Ceratobasidium sp. AG-Ba]
MAASPAAAKQTFKEAQRELWKQRWEVELSGSNARIRTINESTPSKAFHKLAQTVPRRHASLLIQLRTGHIPLNAYLNRFGHVESANCPACDQRAETVEHYLTHCPAYEQDDIGGISLSPLPPIHCPRYFPQRRPSAISSLTHGRRVGSSFSLTHNALELGEVLD